MPVPRDKQIIIYCGKEPENTRVQHEIIEGLVNNMQRDLNFILGPVRNPVQNRNNMQ